MFTPPGPGTPRAIPNRLADVRRRLDQTGPQAPPSGMFANAPAGGGQQMTTQQQPSGNNNANASNPFAGVNTNMRQNFGGQANAGAQGGSNTPMTPSAPPPPAAPPPQTQFTPQPSTPTSPASPPSMGNVPGNNTANLGSQYNSIPSEEERWVRSMLDPSGEDATIKSLMEEGMGAGIVNNRAQAGRSGMGQGALAAMNADTARQNALQAANAMSGFNIAAGQAGIGADIGLQNEATNQFIANQLAALVKPQPTAPPDPTGGQPGSANPMTAPANNNALGAGGQIDQTVSSIPGGMFGSGGSLEQWLEQNLPFLTNKGWGG